MNSNKEYGASYFIILVSGVILAATILTTVIVFKQIDFFTSPHTDTINKYISKGKLESALNLIQKLPADRSETLFLKGKIFLLQAMDIREKQHWINYGNDPDDWFKNENIDAAIQYLKEVTENEGQFNSGAHFLLGLIYKEKGWFQRAENEFKESITEDDSNNSSRLGLASLYTIAEKYYDAEFQLHEAYFRDSANPLISKNMAFLYKYYLDKPESALVWFNRFLRISPKKDLDINLAKSECKEIAQRYPEYIPAEHSYWIDSQPKFKARQKGQ